MEPREVVRRFIDEYQSGGDEQALDECIHADVVDHSRPPGIAPGREGVRQQFAAFRSAFSGFKAEILDMISEGEMVVTRKVFRGRHDNDFQGIPPTKRDVEIHVIDIVRVSNGQIVEHWNCVDRLGLLSQLGVFPPPATA